MKNSKACFSALAGLMLGLSSSYAANSEFAQDVQWTPEKMMEFVDLPNKGTLTTGFFDCMVKHVKNKPYQYCLPNEVKYQDKVVQDLAVEYYNNLPADKKPAFEKQQKEFLSYRSSRCSWSDNPKLVSNPEKITADTINKLKCLLDSTMSRRADLEALTPMNNE